MKNLLLIPVFLLLFMSSHVHAQPHYFRHYEVEDGLSNNAVICSMLDEKGFLWFGTKDGLNRFDGYHFKIFRHGANDTGSIGSNFIHSLYQDPDGIIWVGTEVGLYQYDEKTETFQPLEGTPLSEIREIIMDDKGKLWFIGGLILYQYDTKKEQLKMFSPTEYFQATSLAITSGGQLWVATTTGSLEKYDPEKENFTAFNVFEHSPSAASQWIEKLHATGKGTLLVGTSNQGVKLFDLKNETYKDILTYNEDKTAIFVRDFIRISENEYWIGTESGIFIYNLQTGAYKNLQKQYNDPYSLSDNAIYTFCKDNEGGIWTGTYFGGLNYYPKQYVTFKKYFPRIGENSISGNAVREISPDAYGHLWIGTEDGGLNKLDLQTGKFTIFKPDGTSSGISNSNIHGLLITGDTLWIGTFEHGLDLMNIKTGKVFKHYAAKEGNNLKSNFIYCIYQLHSGKILLGTATGVYQYEKQSQSFVPFHHFPALFYTTILEDSKGNIWIGTYRNGLYYFNPETKEKLHFKNQPGNENSLSHNRINCIFEDSNGRIWIATEGGLCQLKKDEKSFKRYTYDNGLPSNVIYSILEDEEKNLWISTSRGLVCFSLPTSQINIFTKTSGLLSDQFNYNSAYKSSDGRMYFGSVKGLISFDPKNFKVNHYKPPVYITGFQVFNEELAIQKKGSPLEQSIIQTDSLALKYKQSTFSIDFAALGYTSPEMTTYKYKMDGLDEDWTYLNTKRKAYYTKLSPGEYTFRVKAANSSGIWNDNETRLYIHVLPPFWKSVPAYILYVLILLASGYFIIRAYHRRMKEKTQRKAELFEHEKEKEVYQAKIEFFTHVAHEIRTPLTLIKGPMEKVIRKAARVPEIKTNLKIMERNTDRLLTLTRQLLDFRKTETKSYSLNFIKVDIAVLLEEIFQRFKPAAEQKDIDFNLHLSIPHFYAYADVEALNKILSNLMDNAIKYAKNKAEIFLWDVEEGDKNFMIEVKNDGQLIPFELKDRIFEIFYRIKNTEKQGGSGIGLPLARSLTELHKGRLELKYSEDRMNIFCLILPIHHSIEFDPVMS